MLLHVGLSGVPSHALMHMLPTSLPRLSFNLLSMRNPVAGKLMSAKLDVVQLTLYTSPISLLTLLPFIWATEVGKFKVGAACVG